MEINKPININITTLTLFKAIAILILLYLLYLIRDILIVFFVALILASAVDPWVDWMKTKKIPRSIGILLIYLVLFAIIGIIVITIIPPIIQQIIDLTNNLPQYLDKVLSFFSKVQNKSGILESVKTSLGAITSSLQTAAGGIFSTVTGIFGSIFSFFLVLVLTFYMAVEENAIKKLVWSLAPSKHQPYIMQLINRMQKKIGLWLRGQLILCFVIFAMDFVGLSILHVKYALVLSLIAGLTEFIPYVGPILGAIPAVFLAFNQSPMLALFVAVLFYIVQLVENNILVPKIMEKAVGLNPIVSIAALMIGYNLAGVVGAILSIPVTTAASVFFKDMFDGKDAKFEEQ